MKVCNSYWKCFPTWHSSRVSHLYEKCVSIISISCKINHLKQNRADTVYKVSWLSRSSSANVSQINSPATLTVQIGITLILSFGFQTTPSALFKFRNDCWIYGSSLDIRVQFSIRTSPTQENTNTQKIQTFAYAHIRNGLWNNYTSARMITYITKLICQTSL
jgi:hypothetical protein